MIKKLRVTVEGKTYEVEVEELDSNGANILTEPVKRNTTAPSTAQTQPKTTPKQSVGNAEGEQVCAPIPGKVLTVDVKVGDKVAAGDQLLILEAMKMENEIAATVAGEIKEIFVTEGQTVQTGDVLVVIA